MSVRILQGDCRDVLPTLPANSVHCVVTSPPYYGLRDYGTALWKGGDAACDHTQRMARGDSGRCSDDTRPGVNPAPVVTAMQFRDICGKCGARRIDRQLGLEATPDAYIATMVAVFREVRRVLRDDGTLWLNMGDSYNANQGSGFNGNAGKPTASPKVWTELAPKQLLMMPARLALALQADGWWLRSDIIWHKPNPMPESVTDRPTSAHEHVFLLTKAARYFYDAEAVREAQSENTHSRGTKWLSGDMGKVSEAGQGTKNNRSFQAAMADLPRDAGRSCRNVWTIATEAFPEAHFATFPTELAARCIRAGCPEGGTVLDPFAGAGTTLLVADRLQRNAVGIELNADYIAMAERRIASEVPLFMASPPPVADAEAIYDRQADLFAAAAD